MKLTRAGEYAVRIVLHLAQADPHTWVKRRQISQAMDVPYPFLGKIGPQLAAAGLIEIAQGPKGGYRLARAAENISLLDVVEAVEGPIALNQCLIHTDACGRSPVCAVHQIWLKARQDMRNTLASANFADLAAADGPSNC
jgi:Rrf2 family iron-sulfur cluster assembly transcriptional regulator